jgi:hypothetical protein
MLLTSRIWFQGLLRGIIFFLVVVSAVAVGITFGTLMQPSVGLINTALGAIGLPKPDWLGNPSLALFSVGLVDVWNAGCRKCDRTTDLIQRYQPIHLTVASVVCQYAGDYHSPLVIDVYVLPTSDCFGHDCGAIKG